VNLNLYTNIESICKIDYKMDKDEYETVVFNHDFQRDILIQALGIVRKFIIDNKRKLGGSMCIDLALRTVNSRLFADDKLPDYDFYTSEFHRDAYRIGELLVAAGIQNISVIRAYHVSTMRVRVNLVAVADVTYSPLSILEKIPTLMSNDIILVHPHWQILDQYRALSLPFENPPMESMMNRWKKDMERNSLLLESFPINNIVEPVSSYIDKIDDKLLDNNCLHGSAALAYWVELAKPLGFKSLMSYSDTSCTLNGCPLEIYSNDYTKCLPYLDGEHKYYNATLDKIPRYVRCNDVLIYDNTHRLMSAVNVGKYHVAGLLAVLCHLGTKAILYDDTATKANYAIGLELLSFACIKYIDDPMTPLSQLLPITTTYGTSNISESYELQIADSNNRLGTVKQIIAVPKNAYPSNTKKIQPDYYDFQPETSIWYMFDGKICVKPFKLRA
jgi:hypothetical protein